MRAPDHWKGLPGSVVGVPAFVGGGLSSALPAAPLPRRVACEVAGGDAPRADAPDEPVAGAAPAPRSPGALGGAVVVALVGGRRVAGAVAGGGAGGAASAPVGSRNDTSACIPGSTVSSRDATALPSTRASSR